MARKYEIQGAINVMLDTIATLVKENYKLSGDVVHPRQNIAKNGEVEKLKRDLTKQYQYV